MNENPRIIVSLTSFPAAIFYVEEVIKSILGGVMLPDKIVLYLNFEEFGQEQLPQGLLLLAEKNPLFEIRNCDRNTRSYKKLVPALQDFPDDIIVTIDDDIRYHPKMLSRLVKMHRKAPTSIIAHRVRKIKLGAPYKKWRKYKWYDFVFRRLLFSHRALQTGAGGVLYPPHSLDEKMLDADLFMSLAPTQDDLWFWAAAVSKGTYVVPVPNGINALKEVGKPMELSLMSFNTRQGKDRNREAMERILGHYPEIKQKVENEK